MRRAPEVHQFLPSFGFRDAVGNHTLSVRRALSAAGWRGEVWAEDVHPELARQGHRYVGYGSRRSARRGDNVLLYQASTGSRGLVDYLLARDEPKVVYYHNITPAAYFEPYDPAGAINLERGREEMKAIAAEVRVAAANSSYSAEDLLELGIPDVRVVPPYLPATIDVPPDPDYLSWLCRTKAGLDLLFVGRVVPHKGHLHLLRAFSALRASLPGSRLFVVGGWGPAEYIDALFRYRERAGPENVVFTGSLSDPFLAAHYGSADVFVCLSEHEGYGLPLVEAMRRDVPVLAYAAAAVPETLGGSGALVHQLDPLLVAEVAIRLGTDERLRAKVIAGQRARVAEVDAVDRDGMIRDLVETALDG